MLIPHLSDDQLAMKLTEYDEVGYQDVPYMLREKLESRTLIFRRREPTELEQWETNSDAREHRITNNELTLDDYLDYFKHGKSLTIGA
jgi:hypothetical protein